MAAPLPSLPAEPFELSGGDLCLDFANTWGDRERPATERLVSYGDLLAFAQAACGFQASDLHALGAQATAHPARAMSVLRRALTLREVLYRLFSAQARGGATAAGDLEQLNARLGPALAHLRLGTQAGGFPWVWAGVGEHLDAPLWPILRSAADLLASPRLAQVRECDGLQCTWLFLDFSRAHSRRWCSMASCGNRAKARRHHQRKYA
ncbi:MAG TPA: ABATE domain-containing protein [Holophagaceae bacterium]|nr:ABATE domain-containing protein [Holophagaceae bacterium]